MEDKTYHYECLSDYAEYTLIWSMDPMRVIKILDIIFDLTVVSILESINESILMISNF
jgi:hypothetical protein